MKPFKTCEHCGAHLDYGEKCDCVNKETEENVVDNEIEVIPESVKKEDMEFNISDLMVVKQDTIIEEQLHQIKSQITNSVKYVLSLDCTEDTYKEVKKAKANLNHDFNELEKRRKEIKKRVLTPYNNFETVYKECVTDVFKPAIEQISTKTNEVEAGIKQAKQDKVVEYFNEYAQSVGIDFVDFERTNITVTMSVSLKKLKEQVKSFLDKIVGELALIDTQEHKADILVEYKKTLDVANAITEVKNRYDAIEAEKQRIAEEEIKARTKKEHNAKIEKVLTEELDHIKNETFEIELGKPLPEPTPIVEAIERPQEEEKILQLTFTVRGNRKQLSELKAFLINGGYDYE